MLFQFLKKQSPGDVLVFCKKSVLRKFRKIHRKTPTPACNFIKKETRAQVFSCEFCKISRKTFSYRTPPVAASVFSDIYDLNSLTEEPTCCKNSNKSSCIDLA